MPSRRGWALALAAWVALGAGGCDRSPAAPTPRPNLSGRWTGQIYITAAPIPTPMQIDLTDNAGLLSGTGGGADCRFFVMCGSFSSYSVSGSHDGVRVTLNGVTPSGRTWTLTGTLSNNAARMSGTGSGSDFAPSQWELDKRP